MNNWNNKRIVRVMEAIMQKKSFVCVVGGKGGGEMGGLGLHFRSCLLAKIVRSVGRGDGLLTALPWRIVHWLCCPLTIGPRLRC